MIELDSDFELDSEIRVIRGTRPGGRSAGPGPAAAGQSLSRSLAEPECRPGAAITEARRRAAPTVMGTSQ